MMTGDPTAHLPAVLFMGAALLAAFSGTPLLVRVVTPTVGQRLAAIAMTVAAAGGIAGAVLTLLQRQQVTYKLAWPFPFGPAECGIDPLTAFFALPILIVAACCSIYALDYWPAGTNPRTVRKLTFFFGLLVSAMLFVTMARSAGLFLLAWEIMALAAYFVLTTDDHTPEVRDAGTLYLICTHTGTLALFALFALLNSISGSFTFPVAASLTATAPLATALFLLALFGFGFKAGLMPLHIWLPSAHANAPSHVSAIMSGIILKIGIYGLVRTLSFFTGIPLWWGLVVIVLGMVSGVVGVLFALGQHDLKRLLAYHSIENIGIITMGIGTALIGTATGSPTLMLLGMAGALLHVLNHATFKALLFLGAGSVIHAVATREIDRMGGLLRIMPWTAASFIIGAVAICGLPPLNGFVSEFLIYLGFFNGTVAGSGAGAIGTALATPALALIGGLAVACFVKVVGIVFLGTPRAPLPGSVHEATWTMRLPMAVLAIVCLTIGVAPVAVAPLLESAVTAWLPSSPRSVSLASVAPLNWISVLAVALIIITFCLVLWYRGLVKKATVASAGTWGCGYLDPSSRMQYSASSFADMLVSLFAGILRPERHAPHITGSFPADPHFESHVPETVLERIYLPLLARIYEKFLPIRRLQHGHLHLYILYTFITLVVLIVVSLP
ncbi:proton-conducting transporter transmembrane domain-containing protein [Geobacter argillaceus]|uniref:Hydrogenase-4 component B n=1 Tax=Geobacter argillaceus TaxID=345631 RepID=A0A562VP65_9BACT|nr:proton-conducting transporter membrane subunit [Geobacter argillaceus]TWJ19554.1 hydrogenase-4 component B [Geobacter argillaceus]